MTTVTAPIGCSFQGRLVSAAGYLPCLFLKLSLWTSDKVDRPCVEAGTNDLDVEPGGKEGQVRGRVGLRRRGGRDELHLEHDRAGEAAVSEVDRLRAGALREMPRP